MSSDKVMNEILHSQRKKTEIWIIFLRFYFGMMSPTVRAMFHLCGKVDPTPATLQQRVVMEPWRFLIDKDSYRSELFFKVFALDSLGTLTVIF